MTQVVPGNTETVTAEATGNHAELQQNSEGCKHTPGPWGVIRAQGPIATLIRPAAQNFGYIAVIHGDNILRDAALVAAAPELLEACKFALQILSDITTEDFSRGADRPARDALEAAIATAEGRSV